MDYNQQRRVRNSNYNSGRQMNYGRAMYSGREAERNMAARQAGCDTCARQMEREASAATASYDNSCGCQEQRDNRGCMTQANNCTYKRQKGYLEESDSYPIGMSYTPWQSWKCTYDGHRALMSGTIFPELDNPFCAAGRCSR